MKVETLFMRLQGSWEWIAWWLDTEINGPQKYRIRRQTTSEHSYSSQTKESNISNAFYGAFFAKRKQWIGDLILGIQANPLQVAPLAYLKLLLYFNYLLSCIRRQLPINPTVNQRCWWQMETKTASSAEQ